VRSLTSNNDQKQAVNIVRATIDTARSIAVSQHRQAGVVFFEETTQFALPANTMQTAMQLFVEDFNQMQYPLPTRDLTVYVQASVRQYLPQGVKVAALTDDSSVAIATGDKAVTAATPAIALRARAILFDASGQLITRSGLAVPAFATDFAGTIRPGTYPAAYGDWNFFTVNGLHVNGSAPTFPPAGLGWGDASSSPGFFIYSKADYDAQPAAKRPNWIRDHADVILVNANTGTVLQ
jgi:hypothetical protein